MKLIRILRPVSAFMLLVVASLPAVGAQRSPKAVLSEAREQYLAGDYEKALKTYEPLLSDSQNAAAAAAGISDVLLQTGGYDEALAKLDAARQSGQSSAAWQVARARVLLETGRHPDALAAARRAVELDPRSTAGRLLVGQICEITGDVEKAAETYGWFEDLLSGSYPTSAAAITDAGIGLYRRAVLKPGPAAAERTRYVLQELFQPAAEQVDPRYWPAHVAAGDLLLSKYNLPEAAEEYRAALKVNPKLADPHVGLGRIALEEWKFEEVESQLAAALQVNPRSPAAHRLSARLHLTERKYPQALAAAQEALKTNPNDVEALGLLAAAQLRAGEAAAAQATIARAAQMNAKSALVPAELATWLAAARQFQDAEAQFKRAIELAPWWPKPRTALGMMYMEMGDEPAARKVLDASWKLDPYSVETKNTLDLLDKLEKFGREESSRFIVLSSDAVDAAIRPYLSAYMEEISPQVCQDFGAEPEGKTIIELFPSHDSFAVRITGKPWIHTIGACTGRVIAVDAPRVSAAGRPFNWARVLRHEFTHTVTLAATHNRIPHWFTEGLAVWSEFKGGGVRSWEWCNLLSKALRTGRLFTLESLDWAFVRPKQPDDRTLAYAESEWMVEYLIERHGQDVIGRMLQGFDGGKQQPVVFRDVIGIAPEQFHTEFLAWAVRQVQSWGLPTRSLPGVPKLLLQILGATGAAKADLLADLSERYLDSGDLPHAREAASQALALASDHPATLTALMKVTLAEAAGKREKAQQTELRQQAVELAHKLANAFPSSPDAARVLSAAALQADDTEAAVRQLEQLKKACPLDPQSYRGLVGIYLKRGQKEKALPELLELARLQDDDVDLAAKLASLYQEAGNLPEATVWLKRAVRIDPYAVETHAQLAGLLMRSEKFGEAAREYDVLVRLRPDEPKYLTELALSLHRAGRGEEARAAAERAVKMDENSPAKVLLSR